MFVPAHDVHDQRGNEGSREQVAGQHGEADGLRQRNEQELRHSRKKKHWHEHDADAERRNERGDGNLLRPVEDSLLHLLAHAEIALDVFDFDSRVVHENADGECQSAQRHDVDGFVYGPQHDDRNKNGERDGDRDDDRGTPIAKEDRDHDGGKNRRDQRLPHHAVDRCAHKQGLVKQRGDFQLGRQGLRGLGNDTFYAFNNFQCGSVAVFVNRHQRAAVTILAHDIGLRREAIADVSDIAHVESGTVRGFYRQIIQLRDGLRRAVHLNVVFERTELDGTGGKDQVLRIDRIHNVGRREPVRLQLRQVEIDLNLANLPAIRVRSGGSRHRRKIITQKILAQIEELLLGQSLAAQAKLDDGRGGRAIRNDERRRGSRWQAAHGGLADRRDLRDRSLYVRARSKEDLDYAESVHRLRFHVLDIVDRGSDAALGVGHDAVGHIRWRHAGIEPDDRNHWNVDIGEDVGRSAQDGDWRQNNNEQRHDHERIRTPES